MNQKEIKELIEFLIEKDIAEFELERGDVKVRIKRAAPEPQPVERIISIPTPVAVQAPMSAAEAAAPTAAGQVLCIVEAMKLMNEIEADVSGEVVKCLVRNGQPIEYGQDLFAIRAKK